VKPIYLNPDYEGFMPGVTPVQIQKTYHHRRFATANSVLIACLMLGSVLGIFIASTFLIVQIIELIRGSDHITLGTLLFNSLVLIIVLLPVLSLIKYGQVPKLIQLFEQKGVVLDGRMLSVREFRKNTTLDGRPLSLLLEYQFETPEGKTKNGKMIIYDQGLIARAMRSFDPKRNPVVEISVKVLYVDAKTHMVL
jgi:hypothetical protein